MPEELRKIRLFHKIDRIILERLLEEKHIYKRTYHVNSTVHEQGAKCSVMDIVCSGKLIAYSLAQNGSETIMFAFESGDIIGANLLFGKRNRYPMNIYCTADCVLLHITKWGVSALLKEHGFVMPFVQSLSMNSQGMNQKIAMYTQKTLRENLIDYFLALSAEHGSKNIVLPMTKKHLADYFGVQRPSLFRELKKMKDEGLLEIANKEISIRF